MPLLTAKLSVVSKIVSFPSLSEVSTGPVALERDVIKAYDAIKVLALYMRLNTSITSHKALSFMVLE